MHPSASSKGTDALLNTQPLAFLAISWTLFLGGPAWGDKAPESWGSSLLFLELLSLGWQEEERLCADQQDAAPEWAALGWSPVGWGRGLCRNSHEVHLLMPPRVEGGLTQGLSPGTPGGHQMLHWGPLRANLMHHGGTSCSLWAPLFCSSLLLPVAHPVDWEGSLAAPPQVRGEATPEACMSQARQ